MTITDEERLSRAAVLKMLGGDKPVHASTLYRLMDAGRFPRPVKLSNGGARWLKGEVTAAMRKMVEERDPSRNKSAVTGGGALSTNAAMPSATRARPQMSEPTKLHDED